MEKAIIQKELQAANLVYEGNSMICKFKKLEKISNDNAKEIVDEIIKITNNEDYTLLIDASELFFINSEARNYFAKRSNPHTVAVALLVKSNIQSSFANLYLNFSKPIRPTKLFTNKDKAQNWLTMKFSTK